MRAPPAALLLLLLAACASAAPPPIVLFGGLTTSSIQAAVADNATKSLECLETTHGQWEPLWPPSPNMSLLQLGCFLKNIAVTFDPATQTYKPARAGVQTRLVDFGGLDGMTGFKEIYQNFYAKFGYVVGQNFFGADYDWRLSPSNTWNAWYTRTQALIEHAVALNNRPAVILTASFGPQVVLSFLHHMTQDWLDKHIAWLVAESPVWSGSYAALGALVAGAPSVAGMDINSTTISRTIMRTEASSVPSLSWLTPQPGSTNTTFSSEVLVSTPSKSYTAEDYVQLMRDLHYSTERQVVLNFTKHEPDLTDFAPPRVNTFISFGFGIATPGPFRFAEDFSAKLPEKPDVTFIDGDSIVPTKSSLRSFFAWNQDNNAGKAVIHKAYFNQTHALCLVPGGSYPGATCCCYHDVIGLILNGTLPSDPLDLVGANKLLEAAGPKPGASPQPAPHTRARRRTNSVFDHLAIF